MTQEAAEQLSIPILGTSNSIMRGGYVQGLADHPGVVVQQNISIGSSHPPMVAYRLTGDSLSENASRILLIDLSVNEQRALVKHEYGVHALQTSRDVLNYLLHLCARSKIVPVVLLMPERIGFDKPHLRQRLRKHYIELCEHLGVAYYDGYEYAERISTQKGVAFQDLFHDDSHIALEHAYALGQDLAQTLLEWFPLAQHQSTTEICWDFISIPMPADKSRSITRKTSIASACFVRLTPGEALEMQAPPDSELVGIAFNMAQSNCHLVIEGAESRTKSLSSHFYTPQRPLWLVIWSLMEPVRIGSDGKLRLTAIARDSNGQTELHDHGALKAIYHADPQRVELASAVFRHDAQQRETLRYQGGPYIGPRS